jgi:hypothetical protein
MTRHPGRLRQSGQVLIIAAVMVLVMVCGILVGIDMGRLVQARIAFQNGADAAALAAVSVKVGKHHFDTAWRWSMQQEVYKARTAIVWANMIFIDMLMDLKQNPIVPGGPVNGPPVVPPGGPAGPGGPPVPGLQEKLQKAKAEFADKANKAYIYAAKTKEMDKTLFRLYQDWPEAFAEGSAQAARIAWQMNIGEFASERSPSGRPNGQLLMSQADLLENQGGLPTIGGQVYANEKAGGPGLYGKSLVEMTCGVVPFSLSFNGLTRVAKQYTIRVNAGAQPVAQLTGSPAMSNGRYNLAKATPLGGVPLGPRMAWLEPALFSITGSEAGPLH